MKKTILMLLIMAFFAISLKAQFRLGAKAGISSIGASDDKFKDYIDDNDIGFYVGPTAEYLFNGKLGVDASVLYTQKGVKFKSEKTHRFGYIEIPINAKYIHPLSEKVKVYGSAGPYFSFKVGGNDGFTIVKNELKGKWNTKNFGVGLNFSGGIELFHFLQLGISYGLGFTNNYKQTEGLYSIKDRVWSFAATAYF